MGGGPTSTNRTLAQQVREILDDLVGPEGRELYVAACELISGGESRARRLMAAAGIREVMDLIEEAAGYKHEPPDGRSAVSDLDDAWRIAQRTETGSGSGVTAFEPTLEEFFERFRNIPSRRKLSVGTLRFFDPTLRETSPVVQRDRVQRWVKLRKDLNDVVHRNTSPTTAQFDELLQRFEQFLIRWLRPPTALDQSVIDALLREGPPSA
jgi:hypothetical protein